MAQGLRGPGLFHADNGSFRRRNELVVLATARSGQGEMARLARRRGALEQAAHLEPLRSA